jgi:hypothetical protein
MRRAGVQLPRRMRPDQASTSRSGRPELDGRAKRYDATMRSAQKGDLAQRGVRARVLFCDSRFLLLSVPGWEDGGTPAKLSSLLVDVLA